MLGAFIEGLVLVGIGYLIGKGHLNHLWRAGTLIVRHVSERISIPSLTTANKKSSPTTKSEPAAAQPDEEESKVADMSVIPSTTSSTSSDLILLPSEIRAVATTVMGLMDYLVPWAIQRFGPLLADSPPDSVARKPSESRSQVQIEDVTDERTTNLVEGTGTGAHQ